MGKKVPMQESLFNKVTGSEACNLIKNRLQYSRFPIYFPTFSRTHFFYGTTPFAAIDYFELYNLESNSNNILCQGKLPQFYTNLANLYFSHEFH